MNETSIQKFLRSELSFYISLVGAILTIAAFYYGLTNQLNLYGQKLEMHINSTIEEPAKIASLSEKVAILFSYLKINDNR